MKKAAIISVVMAVMLVGCGQPKKIQYKNQYTYYIYPFSKTSKVSVKLVNEVNKEMFKRSFRTKVLNYDYVDVHWPFFNDKASIRLIEIKAEGEPGTVSGAYLFVYPATGFESGRTFVLNKPSKSSEIPIADTAKGLVELIVLAIEKYEKVDKHKTRKQRDAELLNLARKYAEESEAGIKALKMDALFFKENNKKVNIEITKERSYINFRFKKEMYFVETILNKDGSLIGVHGGKNFPPQY